MTSTVTVDLADLLHLLREAGALHISSNQLVRLTNAALLVRLANLEEAFHGGRSERVAIADVCPGDLVSETAAGPFLPVLANWSGLLRVDGREPGAEDPLWIDHATGPSTTVARLL